MALRTPSIIVGRAADGDVNVISTNDMSVSAVNTIFIPYFI